MNFPQIENLTIQEIPGKILLIHEIKPPFYFSCCDGLLVLPKRGRNLKTIILDLNIEPHLITQLNDIYGPISDYICSHCHMDHMAHIHQWESIGAKIHAPIPEYSNLLDLYNFYTCFGFNDVMDFSVIEKFGEINKYQHCSEVKSFTPGKNFIFEQFNVSTIHFSGHSRSHVGFFLPKEKILHISCMGFDQAKPGVDGFGPWYGFNECSIRQYYEDIRKAELLYLEQANYLTSSHSFIVKNPDKTPFKYMRRKIKENQEKMDNAILNLNSELNSEELIDYLLSLDLYFPKKKMRAFLLEIYNYWETGFIEKHLERSEHWI